MALKYKGTKWYKCDLHLHTPASKCFRQKEVTAEEWVDKAIERGLDCVAITDHNTGNWVDAIKRAAVNKPLIVFPGVEITCDTSKVHLLILFNVSATSEDVDDFILHCGIERKDFAEQKASTKKTIFEIAELANLKDAIIIPAHIDEYNGLENISYDNLEKFYDLPNVLAVQVVHDDFMNSSLLTNDNEELRLKLNTYYNSPKPPIDFEKLKNWHTPVKKAKERKLAILTFSDNPHEKGDPQHGLDGIGTRYTWIKMDDTPTLEGIRQAFILGESRIKNDFTNIDSPYVLPDLWFKSITINNTEITGINTPLKIEFSPQLTAIIGGRGSGKSSILRFIRGLFNRTNDLSDLEDIINDHNNFYKKHVAKKQGVLHDNTEIIIEFVRNGVLHRLIASNIVSSVNQTITIQKLDEISAEWIDENGLGYISFFNFEQYSQKQIYEIAQEPNCLRERIDNAVPEIDELRANRSLLQRKFFEKGATIRTIQEQISSKGILKTELDDLTGQIILYQQSGIAGLITTKDKFDNQAEKINQFLDDVYAKEENIKKLIKDFVLVSPDLELFEETEKTNIGLITGQFIEGFEVTKQGLQDILEQTQKLREKLEDDLANSSWYKSFTSNQEEFSREKASLEEQGINDILNFESLKNKRQKKALELKGLEEIEDKLGTEVEDFKNIKLQYLNITKEITKARIQFVKDHLQSDRVRVDIKAFRNKSDFETRLRRILQRNSSFDVDIDFLTSFSFSGDVISRMDEIVTYFKKIRSGETISKLSGYFHNLVKGLNETQMEELELFYPEDEIEIKYKPSDGSTFKPLSTASAGQKTTAVLTLILSQGNVPLILDQPEDDLDNRLVYELIVDRLKHAKERRQIIVVTHNANIPVNGDAELIVSMNSESKKLEVLHTGTVEEEFIKKEICDVMEGSKHAFEMRSMRYKNIS